jgi:hypothetical protein
VIGSGPDKPAGLYTIDTMIPKNQSAIDIVLYRVGPIIEDALLNNNTKPIM